MKCLAVDYDGTLKRQGKINLNTIEALKSFRAEGNIFGIVTGRSVQSIILELAHFGVEIDFLVANNGGVIASVDGEVLSVETIELAVVNELIQLVQSFEDCASYVLNDGRYRARNILNDQLPDIKYGQLDSMVDEAEMLAKGRIAQMVISLSSNDHRHEYAKLINERFDGQVYGQLDSMVDEAEMLAKGRIAQMVISLSSNDHRHEYAKLINERFDGQVIAYPNERCIDIVPFGVSKASGLAKAIASYKLDRVVAVGDNYNDISMLEAYEGVTFNDSFDEVKQAASFCIDDIYDLFTKYSILSK